MLMDVMNMLNECLYEWMLLPLCMRNSCICVWSTSMHYVLSFLWVHMFMGLVARMVNAMVAFSSPIGGLGTWQLVVSELMLQAWAWMTLEWSYSDRRRTSFCPAEIRSWWQKTSTNLSKCLNCRFIKTLSGRDFRCSGELDESTLDGG